MFGASMPRSIARNAVATRAVQGLQVALHPLLSAERRRLGSRRSVGGRKVGYPSRPSACRASRRNPPSSQPRCRSPRWSRSTAAARRLATWTIGSPANSRSRCRLLGGHGNWRSVPTRRATRCARDCRPARPVLDQRRHMDVATADALFGSEGAEAFAHPAVTRRVADLETRRPRKRCADGQQPAAVQLGSFCREPTHVGQVGSEFVDAMAHGRVGLDLAAGQLELKIQSQCRRGFRNRSIVGGRQPGVGSTRMNSSSTPTVGVVDSWRPAVDSVEQVAPMLASTRSVEGGNRPEEAPFSSGERGLWSALPTSRKRQRVLAHRMNLGTGVPGKTYCVGLGKTRPQGMSHPLFHPRVDLSAHPSPSRGS